MLALARVRLDKAGLRNTQVRQADIYALPFPNAFADRLTLHQVLHYLDDPSRAFEEMARVLKPGGAAIIVDFAPHELEVLRDKHAHRRLGIASEHLSEWAQKAGLRITRHETLPPPARNGKGGLTVSLWQVEPQQQQAVQKSAAPVRHQQQDKEA
jgi:demethylmenaquinone methyltransferase/2-methoxy-6-polyprenyl-1,4-benzoquinol methylase/ArsR family transcriptional regulator